MMTVAELQAAYTGAGWWMGEDSDHWVPAPFLDKLTSVMMFTPAYMAEALARGRLSPKIPIAQIPTFEKWLPTSGLNIGSDGIVVGTADNTPMDYYSGQFFNSMKSLASGYTPFGGPRIWQETLEKIGLPGDPIGSMIEAGQGPVLVAAVATAGVAAGAFAGGEIAAESGTVLATGEGMSAAEISAAEYSAYASEFGTLDTALVEGPVVSELSTTEYSALADAADTFDMSASAPASQTLSIPPDTLPSPPPSGGGFSMPSATTLAQKALPLALKALSKSGSGTVSAPRPVAAPQPLYLTSSGDAYLTDYQDNRMLWIVGGTLAALGLLSVTRRKGKRS